MSSSKKNESDLKKCQWHKRKHLSLGGWTKSQSVAGFAAISYMWIEVMTLGKLVIMGVNKA